MGADTRSVVGSGGVRRHANSRRLCDAEQIDSPRLVFFTLEVPDGLLFHLGLIVTPGNFHKSVVRGDIQATVKEFLGARAPVPLGILLPSAYQGWVEIASRGYQCGRSFRFKHQERRARNQGIP